MTILIAILLYLGLVGFVSALLAYYFKVIRPKDEQKLLERD